MGTESEDFLGLKQTCASQGCPRLAHVIYELVRELLPHRYNDAAYEQGRAGKHCTNRLLAKTISPIDEQSDF
jgi:hypothetical protein